MPNLLTYEGLAEFAIIDVERGIRWVGLVVIFFTFIFYYLIALCYIVWKIAIDPTEDIYGRVDCGG